MNCGKDVQYGCEYADQLNHIIRTAKGHLKHKSEYAAYMSLIISTDEDMQSSCGTLPLLKIWLILMICLTCIAYPCPHSRYNASVLQIVIVKAGANKGNTIIETKLGPGGKKWF